MDAICNCPKPSNLLHSGDHSGDCSGIHGDNSMYLEKSWGNGYYYPFDPYLTQTSTTSGLCKTSISYKNCAIT